ncbi:MAG: hypothetical protein L6Q57_00150 [Alphaproteobacteria bacterium]|nr:hypothetical protein [Alphaproteobacteria bacterium]
MEITSALFNELAQFIYTRGRLLSTDYIPSKEEDPYAVEARIEVRELDNAIFIIRCDQYEGFDGIIFRSIALSHPLENEGGSILATDDPHFGIVTSFISDISDKIKIAREETLRRFIEKMCQINKSIPQNIPAPVPY